MALRIACSRAAAGLRYQLFFDDRSLDGDASMRSGVRLIVDKMSAPYLTGAKIDFSDTIESQGFTIDNPHAGGSCACGAPSADLTADQRPGPPFAGDPVFTDD